jgi:hypothetical protein
MLALLSFAFMSVKSFDPLSNSESIIIGHRKWALAIAPASFSGSWTWQRTCYKWFNMLHLSTRIVRINQFFNEIRYIIRQSGILDGGSFHSVAYESAWEYGFQNHCKFRRLHFYCRQDWDWKPKEVRVNKNEAFVQDQFKVTPRYMPLWCSSHSEITCRCPLPQHLFWPH